MWVTVILHRLETKDSVQIKSGYMFSADVNALAFWDLRTLHTMGKHRGRQPAAFPARFMWHCFTLVPSWLLTGENWGDRNTAGQGPVLAIPGSLLCLQQRGLCQARPLTHITTQRPAPPYLLTFRKSGAGNRAWGWIVAEPHSWGFFL